jgi:glutathione S-transferase
LKLALFHLSFCPFCWKVRWAAYRLDIQLELLNVAEASHRKELLKARGKGTVPVLRVTREASCEYLPESSDIVRYLEAKKEQSSP